MIDMISQDKPREQEARGELRKYYSEMVVEHYLDPRNLGGVGKL
jgi:hypothetical protein